MNNQATVRDWCYVIILVAIWGSAFLFIKLALQSFTPTTMVLLRLACGAAIMLVVLAIKTEYLQAVSPKLWLYLIAMAVLGNALPFTSIGWGQQYISSGIAGLMMAFVPLSTLLMAHFFLPDEKITQRKLFGFILGFAGIIVLMAPQMRLTAGNLELAGMLAMLLGALSYSASNILAKLRPPSNDVFTTALVLSISTLVMLPVSLSVTESGARLPVSQMAVVSILFLGILGGAYATFLYYRVLRSAGAAFVSQMNYLIPIWALVVGAIFLDEKISANAVAALALILFGIFIAQTGNKKNV